MRTSRGSRATSSASSLSGVGARSLSGGNWGQDASAPSAGGPSDINTKINERWIRLWNKGLPVGQGFDKGTVSPLLHHLLASGQLTAQGKRVLVPACGRGYDLAEFARAGAAAVDGLEVAPAAVRGATELADRELRHEHELRSRVRCLQGDFLAWGAQQQGPCTVTDTTTHPDPALRPAAAATGVVGGGAWEAGATHTLSAAAALQQQQPPQQGQQQVLQAVSPGMQYDLGYDYTFSSYLPLPTHPRWAQAWAAALAPGATLVTLLYPTPDPSDDGPGGGGGGPPYALGPGHYAGLLQPVGFELVHSEAVPPSLSLPGREGREHLLVWRRLPAAATAAPVAAPMAAHALGSRTVVPAALAAPAHESGSADASSINQGSVFAYGPGNAAAAAAAAGVLVRGASFSDASDDDMYLLQGGGRQQ